MMNKSKSSLSTLCWLRQIFLMATMLMAGALAHAQVVSLLGAHGKFVQAAGDQVSVNSSGPAVGAFEQWQMTRNGNVAVLKSYHGKFLSAQPDGSVVANRTAVGPWEQFQVIDVASGVLAFRTAHGKYLVAEPNGAFLGNRTAVGPWEQFRVSGVGSATAQPTPAVQPAAAPAAQMAAVDEPTEFFWKGSYGRGVGTVLDACPAGKTQRGALCYDSCRDGYSDNGTLTCATKCPSGYSDRGAICHYEGTGSYSPVRWDGCKSRAPGWLGGGCIGGTVEDGCRDGYTKRASVCYYERVPAGMSGTGMDPTKGTYNLSPVAMVCGGGKQQDAGLCYTPCRAGYNGVGPVCWAAQPSGYVDCGLGYAISSTACGFIVTDQVVGVLSLVKDACALSNFPGVSQACSLGGSKYMQGKALAKSGVKSVSELASNSALAAKVSNKAKNMMAAMQKAQPAIDRIVGSFGAPIKSLAGKGISALPAFGADMAKVGEAFKDPATIASLYVIAQTLRSAAEEPPFKLSGTPTEQAFKIIRDISAQYGMGVALYTLMVPGFEATPPGQAVVASASLLGAVSAYLYTAQGQ